MDTLSAMDSPSARSTTRSIAHSTAVEPSTSVCGDAAPPRRLPIVDDDQPWDKVDPDGRYETPKWKPPTWLRPDFKSWEAYSSPDPADLPPLSNTAARALAVAIAYKLSMIGKILGTDKAAVAGSGALWLYEQLAFPKGDGEAPLAWRPGDIDIFVFGCSRTAMKRAALIFAEAVDGLRKKHPSCSTIYDVHFNPVEGIPPFSFVSAPQLSGKDIVSHFDISVTRVLVPLTTSLIEGFGDFQVEPEVRSHIRSKVATIHPLRGLLDPWTKEPRTYLDSKMIGRCHKYQTRGYTFVFGDPKEDLYGRCRSNGAKALANYVLSPTEVAGMQAGVDERHAKKLAERKRRRFEEEDSDDEEGEEHKTPEAKEGGGEAREGVLARQYTSPQTKTPFGAV